MKLDAQTQENIKRKIGERAASFVEEGMLVGLGTGSTSTYFIRSLIKRCQEGLKVHVVSSSNRSLHLAVEGGIPTVDMNQVTDIDLTIDGADEIDPKNRMVKGGGGAHTREKILATSSKKMLVIVDESKLVEVLGKFGVAIEILPFGRKATLAKLRKIGYEGKMRTQESGEFTLTDNGNYLFDIHSPTHFPTPEEDHKKIIEITGVVETGFFFDLPLKVLVGYKDGTVALRR
ncbi:MAG: Ribose-5-phosphate isomerase A [Chlamydiae bacterium]|nr:Ribose-5-phosphate isomerase A [Chlamydiota bacterium]